MTNQLKTFVLLISMSALILFLGKFIGGNTGMIIAFGIALVMNVGSYWYSDKIVLRMYHARIVSVSEAPKLHAILDELCAVANMPKPRLALIPQEAPNAFATGRNPEHAVVGLTEGIMQILSTEELKAVIAHELGHILNRDILISSISSVMATVVMMVANMLQWTAIFGGGSQNSENGEGGGSNIFATLAIAFIAPIAASLIQMAISRSREFIADETGARLCGNPNALASALNKLEQAAHQIPLNGNAATENMFIVNPFSATNMAKWFSTHPPIAERVARLQNM